MAQAPLSPLEKLLSEQPQPQPRSRGVFPEQYDSGQATPSTGKAGEIPAELVPVIAEVAKRYDVPANIIAGIASKESEFNPNALGVQTKYGRAKGIMQYIDDTARGVGIDPYDPAQSIDAAGRQLRERLDKGYDIKDAVREHFAGPDRAGWGPKTAEYGDDVLRRAGQYMGAFAAATRPEDAPENAPEGGYTAEYAQELLGRLNKDEPGRYVIASPEQIAALADQTVDTGTPGAAPDAMLPERSEDGPTPDGALSATGKALRNVPGNFQEAAAGQMRSFGEGIDDQTLVSQAAQAGVIERLQKDGIITMVPDDSGLLTRNVPTLPDGRTADTASIAQYLRANAEQLGLADAGKANAITELGQELGQDARKDRLEINPDGPLAKYSSMIIGSTAEMIPALVAAAVTKSPSVAMGMIGGQSYGQAYERARENKQVPQNPSEAASYAMAQAVAEAIPSALPVHAILAPGQQFFKGLLKAGSAEAVQESLTGAIQAGIDKGTIDPNMTWADARQQIMDSAIAGAGAGMALRGGTVGMRRAGEALRSPERDLGRALNESVDSTALPGDAQQQAVDALNPNNYATAPNVDQATGEIIAPAPTAAPVAPVAETPAPSGPLGRALAAGQPPAPTVAAPDATVEALPAALPEVEAFAGEPGQQLEIRMPGVEPFRAQVESYVDGEVLLVDEGGDRFQMTRDELADAVPVNTTPEPAAAPVTPQAEPVEKAPITSEGAPALPTVQVGPDADGWLNQNAQLARSQADRAGITEQIESLFAEGKTAAQVRTALGDKLEFLPPEERGSFIVQVRASLGIPSRGDTDGQAEFEQWKAQREQRNAPAPKVAERQQAKPLEEQSEAELRESLKYLARQARSSGGWNKPLMEERRRIESAIATAQKAAATATDVEKTASDVAESASDVEKTASDVKESGTDVNPLEKFRPEYEAKERERLAGLPEERILQSIQITNQFQRDHEVGEKERDPQFLDSAQAIKARELDELKRRGYSDEQLAEAASLLPNIQLPKVGDKVNYARGPATVLESSERGVKVRQRGKETMLSVSQYMANQGRTADDIYTRPSWATEAQAAATETPAPAPAKENKWFGSLAKARGYISGKGLEDTHEVQKVGARYEIAPKATSAKNAPVQPVPVEAFKALADTTKLTDTQREAVAAYNNAKGKEAFTMPGNIASALMEAADSNRTTAPVTLYRANGRQFDGVDNALTDRVKRFADRPLVPTTTDKEHAITFGGFSSGQFELQEIVVEPGVGIVPITEGNTGEAEVLLRSDDVEIERTDYRQLSEEEARQEFGDSVSEPIDVARYVVRPKKPSKEKSQQEAFGVDRVRGEPINDEWTAFNQESGTKGVPRSDMPQIKAEHRGAMVNFLNARGIEHQEVEVPAANLKPTQAEYSPDKVQRAKEYDGGQRAILVSNDGHVVDGHHQWLADLDMGQSVRAIQLDAPIDQVLEQVREFPSATVAEGATENKPDARAERKKLPLQVEGELHKALHTLSQAEQRLKSAVKARGKADPAVRELIEELRPAVAKAQESLANVRERAAESGADYTKALAETEGEPDLSPYGLEAGSKASNPQEKPATRSDSEINPPKKPTKKQQAEAARAKLAEHFTPGNILKNAYWGNHERVESFTPREDGSWSVTVQTVEQRDGEWTPVGAPRTHQTAPSRGDVVVERAAEPAPPAKPAASANKIFTEDAAAKARAVLKSKLTQLNSGIDPEILQAGITLAGYHIEKGARSFAAYAKAMGEDLGDMVKPYLKSWYMGVKYDPRAAGFTDMSTAAEVEAFDVDQAFTPEESNNAPSPAERVEPDSQQPSAAEPVDAAPAGDAGRADAARAGGAGADTGRQRRAGQRDNRLSADGATTGREPGNQRVYQHDGEFRPALSVAGGTERTGGGSDRNAGKSADRKRAKQIARNVAAAGTGELAQRVKAQKAAANAPTTWADPTSIDKALPLLLPEQRADVLKAEIRLANANGILYTNGTGTGKTASGLGIAKRYYNDGQQDIIVVVPTDKIASDWVKFAELLGMPLKKLDGLDDNGGSGPVITTYANFGQNQSLAKRNWQLVIPDESHYLSSNEDGDTTAALQQLRALTGHHAGMHKWMRDRYSGAYELRDQAYLDLVQAKADEAPAREIAAKEQAFADANATIDRLQARVEPRWRERWAKQENIGRVAFLSATPFAYQKNVQYAEGFLFDFVAPAELYADNANRSQAYNAGDAYQQFMMRHFGYRMRYNKLTAPEAGVESQVMERQFNNWLKAQGALSGRRLEVPFDYDRKFVSVDDAIGTKIDDALRFLREGDDGAHRKVYEGVMSSFDHQSRMYLLEALKARAVIPMIQADLKAGRKVVVFHDYNKGGAENPFTAALRNIGDPEVKERARKVLARPMFQFDLSGLGSPIDTLTEAFPDALLFNGKVSKAKRRANADRFNDDATGPMLFIAQSDAAREGVSLHDTSGQYPRVEYNLGMPTRPVAATQIEGRIYRTGQASDAMFRYLTTGTGWEASAFASKIAERASTAENLALGDESRDLRSAFIDAYNNAEEHSITPNDGKGGKASDRGRMSSLSPWQIAKSHYWAQQKNSKRRDQREGADYFATAEPVGLKKVQWADIQPGEQVLEPSAGHGAIARFFPEQADATLIEPSYDLSQRAALANGAAKIVNDTFESHHISNKYDAVVMNPPFGSGGKTALEHLTKAARHLREGGRIVVTLPRGGMADRRLDAFMADPAHANLHTVADIEMPGVAFGRAGTNVATRVLVLERQSGEDVPIQPRKIDLSQIDDVNELFDRLENLELPPRLPQQVKASLLDGSGTNGNRYDAQELDSALRNGPLGKVLTPLLDSGRLVVHQDAPSGMHALTQGWTDSDGNIHLVASQLTSDNAMPVLLHEAFHTGTDQLLGSPRWNNLMARLNTFHKAAESGSLKGEWADAYRRVQAAQAAGDTMSQVRAIEELGAYAVEHYEQAPPGIKKWVDSVLGAVKDWLSRRFGIQAGDVTPAQLRAMAVAALRANPQAAQPEAPARNSLAEVSAEDLSQELRAQYPGLKLSLFGKNGRATLSRIELPLDGRNAGAGTAIMQRITDWADQTGTTLALTPSGDFGGSKPRLTDFYKRFGFVENKGKNKDYEISESMYREPQAANRPGVRYSLGTGLPSKKAGDSWFSQKLTDAMAGPKSSGQYSLLALAPMDRLVEELTREGSSARDYLKHKRDMDAYRNGKHREFDDIAQEWLKLNLNPKTRQASEDMAVLMHDATIAQIDPAKPLEATLTPKERDILKAQPGSVLAQQILDAMEAKRPEYDALRQRFLALPQRVRAQYIRVRDAYKATTEELDKIIADNLAAAIDLTARKAERQYKQELEEIDDDGLQGQDRTDAIDKATKKYQTAVTKGRMNKKARLTMLRQQFEANRLNGPYFPLSRFGDYFVTVRDDDGKVLNFSRFESKAEQARFAKRMEGKGKVESGLLSNSQALRGAVDSRFVAEIEEILGKADVNDSVRDQVWQRYLESMPDMSLRKGFIHRKNREGYTQDATRAFAHKMFHSAHQMGRLKYGNQMQEAIDEAQIEARHSATPERDMAVVNELGRRHDYVMNPKGGAAAQALTSAAFIYQLSMSPAAALVNMAQTFMVGVPVIGAQYGVAKTTAELARASKDFAMGRGTAQKAKSLTPDERLAMAQAYQSGLIESTQSHNLAGVGDGVGVRYSAVRNKVMGVVAWAFHQAERTNREVTYLAAYRLARDAGETHAQAVDSATSLTYKTHFDYGNTNRPRVMHGDTAKVMLVFRNYQVNMLWRLFRDTHQALRGDKEGQAEAVKQLAGMTGMMALNAGVKGVWMYSIAMIIASMLFGDDAEEQFKKGTIEALGPTAAGLLLNGVPGHLTGTALSERIGMPDLWFRSPDRQMEGREEFNYWQSQLLGFLPSIAQNLFTGYQQATDGNLARGLETAAPKAIKDLMRAYRYGSEGATTLRGDQIVSEFTPGELFGQAMGFTPAVLSEQYDRNNQLKNAEQRIMDARGKLLAKMAVAHRTKDAELRGETLEEIKAFNRENRRVAITPGNINSSIRSRQSRGERTEGGLYLNPKLDKQLRDNMAPAIYR